MRLVNAIYGLDLTFQENVPEVLVLEEPTIMRDIVHVLWKQCAGEEGAFVLSDSKILKIDKNIEMIINPFALDFQSRKITSALFSKMTVAGNEQVEEKCKINTALINLLDTISSSLNYSGITYQLDFVWADLFKMYGVKIERQENLIIEIIEYMKVFSELCGISVICFVNLKSYLNHNEIMDLYQNAMYNKINLLLIEPFEAEVIGNEHVTIIDKDQCLIER